MKNTIKVNNAIALCFVYKDFGKLIQNFKMACNSKEDNRAFFANISKIAQGKFCFGASKVKRFYEDNKVIIDTINIYSDIFGFMADALDFKGNLENHSMLSLYNYLIAHEEDAQKVLATLYRIKELGFDKITYDEALNFDKEYTVYTNFSRNQDVVYLDNMRVVPGYRNNLIKYRSESSPYKITADMHFRNIISTNFNEIEVNSLTFDPERLPLVISREEIFDKIIALKDEKDKEYTAVRDSVDLSITVSDLYAMFNEAYDRFNKLTDVKEKEKLQTLLQEIHSAIIKMREISVENDKSIIESDLDITKEILASEQKEFVRRREMSKIDWC